MLDFRDLDAPYPLGRDLAYVRPEGTTLLSPLIVDRIIGWARKWPFLGRAGWAQLVSSKVGVYMRLKRLAIRVALGFPKQPPRLPSLYFPFEEPVPTLPRLVIH